MKKVQLMASGLLLVLLLVACAPKPAPPQAAPAPQASAPAASLPAARAPAAVPAAATRPAWQVEWERVLAEAKKEGKVVFAATMGSDLRNVLVQGLQKEYGIPVENISGRDTEISAKIFAERRAGLYLWDAYVGGATEVLTSRKPAGVVEPMEPYLVLPDVTDPQLIKKVWYRGELWWVDRDHSLLATLMFPYPPLAINTSLVKPDEIKSYNDLLDPKWKGKMDLRDPTQSGGTFAPFMMHVYGQDGPDWLRKLAKQEVIIMRDQRLQVEWLAHGKVAIALGPKAELLTEFKTVGAPIQAITPKEGTWLSMGAGGINIFNRPAHPNAAKVFVNWLLTKEAQTTFSKVMGGQSMREDVPTDFLPPDQIRQTGVKYWEKEREEETFQKEAQFKIFKEIFGHLIK